MPAINPFPSQGFIESYSLLFIELRDFSTASTCTEQNIDRLFQLSQLFMTRVSNILRIKDLLRPVDDEVGRNEGPRDRHRLLHKDLKSFNPVTHKIKKISN